MKKFNQICADIKNLKIQGASEVAKAGVKAYFLKPSAASRRTLVSLRPTEPALFNAIHFAEKHSLKDILSHFQKAQEKINLEVLKIIKTKKIIFTHCHSNTVVKSLINAKKKGMKFEVYSTETRPLYQGRLTAKQLAKANISVTAYADSAVHEAVKKSSIVLLGADAILKNSVINKVGSAAVAEIAKTHKIPLYIISDSWKFYPQNIKIEERDFHEVWSQAPRHVKVRNPAFESIPRQQITKIISEFGILAYDNFLKQAKKNLTALELFQ